MDSIKRIYRNSLDFVGDTPSFKQEWRWVALYGVIIYILVLALRLSFAGRWDNPELWVNGERILSTHDAYFWLAKAKGVGDIAHYPLAYLTKQFHELTSIPLGDIGFWGPAVMAALVGCMGYLWGWLLAGHGGGIVAGLIGSLTPGFFYRSRLGYYDTDMFTLLAPLLVAWLLAYWLAPHTKKGWLYSDAANRISDYKTSLLQAFFFGFIARYAVIWHLDILRLCISYVFLCIFFILVCGVRGKRVQAFYGLCIFILAAFPGTLFGYIIFLEPVGNALVSLTGIGGELAAGIVGCASALALLATIVAAKEKNIRLVDHPLVCAAVLLFLIFDLNLVGSLSPLLSKLQVYYAQSAPSTEGKEVMGPIFPSVMQSVIEASKAQVSAVFERGAFNVWIGVAALASAVIVVVVRPLAVFLLPLIGLQALGLTLGVRFTMFGGAPLMIFLSVGIYWLCKAAFPPALNKKAIINGVQVVIAVSGLILCYVEYASLPLTPVMSKVHAEALVELGKLSPKDAMIWTWWDWGYASQYYAGRETVVDGGRHSGRNLFPVGFVMSTALPEKANHMVRFSAQYPSKKGDIGLYPAQAWDTIPRKDIVETLDSQLSQSDYPAAPKQYFITSWKDMRIIKWITYFGNWGLQTGETREATTGNFNPGELGINFQRGAVMNRQGGGGLVKDITVLDWNSSQSQSYFMNSMSPQLLPKQQHLLVNKVTRQSVLMDRVGYESLMRKLLTDDPNDPEISKYFKIVVDKLPFARIYEVIQ